MTPPSIPKRMKAIQVTEYGKPYQINEVDVPQDLGPEDLLVKLAVASRCHTDGMVQTGTFGTKLPCTGSHEGAGTVVAVGAGVDDFKVGDRVMCGLPLHPCGKCSECTGPENCRQYCTSVTGHIGIHIDGCFAEYVKVDSRPTTPLSDNVSLLDAAPLACAGRTVWRGVSQADLEPGQWLAVVGSGGGLGHIGVQFAKAKGLRVIGIDARDDGLTLSKSVGADVILDAREGKDAVVKAVQAATGGVGVDATLTLSDAPDAAALGCAVTKMHGVMVQIAQPDEVKIPFPELVFRDIRVKGSVLCSPGESREMMRFISEHGISVKTNPFYGLDKIHDLVEVVDSGKIQGKAVLVIDKEQLQREKSLTGSS